MIFLKLQDDSFNDVYIVKHVLKDGSLHDSMADIIVLYNESTSPAYEVLKECIINTNQENSLD